MSRVTGHCRGCNQDFPAGASDACPLCGEKMTVAPDSPTLDLDQTLPGDEVPGSPHPSSDLSESLIGSQLSLYSVQRFLGRGGMASVFQARHNMLHRMCAIKVLNPALERRAPAYVQMFLREARSAASLVHPHVVAVHNVGDARGLHFLEMEYVPGQSLQSLLMAKKQLAPLEATRYLVQCCSALAQAHRDGLIHRDFKPANILVREDGVAKLADFGLAKRIAKTPTGAAAADQALSGTPYYMAPELFGGCQGTRASDVYAVGASYYYMLTGRFPFQHRNIAQLMEMHQREPVPDPRAIVPSIPEPVVALVRRALAKDPGERFSDGAELHEQMQRVFTQLRSLSSIVQEGLKGCDATIQQRENGSLEVLVSLQSGRTQRIFVREADSAAWSTRLVRVYSICGKADPSYYRRALELNAQVPHGSLAIEPIDGVPHFVMLDTSLRATCTPADVRHSVLEIAQWADDVEQALSDDDRF